MTSVVAVAYSHPTASERDVHDLLWTKAQVIDALIARMREPGPRDDYDEPDYEAQWEARQGDPEAEMDAREDAYERDLERNHP